MRPLKSLGLIVGLLFCSCAFGQQYNYYINGFLQQQNAFQARLYLGIPTNAPGGGTVTSFSMGNLPPLFTSSVATPTTTPTVTLSLTPQPANTVFAGPSSGGASSPSFRALVSGDLPDISAIVRGDVSATAPVLYDSGTGIFSMHVADGTHDGYLSSSDWSIFSGKGIGTVLSVTNSGIQSANNSLVAVSNAPTLGVKSISGGTGISVADSGGTNLVITSTASSGVTSITNASQPLVGDSMISNFTAPVPSIKSIVAGSGVSLSDTGTNIVVSASGAAGNGSPTDLMAYQTNYDTTYRYVPSDLADGTSLGSAMVGFGDTISLGFTVGTGTAVVRQNFNNSFPLGPWVEMKPATASNACVFLGTQTFNTIAPYPNGGFYYQTYVFVRNTNTVSLKAGFAAAYSTVSSSETTITNYAIFRYSTLSNDSTWHGVVCDATNRTFVDTGAQLIPNTGYLLQIYKTNGTTNVVFVVNRTNSVITTSNAPNRVVQASDLMGCFASMDNLDTNAKTNWYRYFGYTVDWSIK